MSEPRDWSAVPPMRTWTIYHHHPSFPGKYVVRVLEITHDGRLVAHPMGWACATLEAARAHVPQGMYNIGRQAQDDITVLETWL